MSQHALKLERERERDRDRDEETEILQVVLQGGKVVDAYLLFRNYLSCVFWNPPPPQILRIYVIYIHLLCYLV